MEGDAYFTMEIWDKLRTPPESALKKIQGGRLKGMTDISPMWRYKVMTENFGMCGFGWKYIIEKQWVEEGTEGQKFCFVNILLWVSLGGEWSAPIPGTGGHQIITKETKGLHDSDEGFKMATTDALSVAMKMLGVGADIYMGLSDSKYSKPKDSSPSISVNDNPVISEPQRKRFYAITKQANWPEDQVKELLKSYKIESSKEIPRSLYEKICKQVDSNPIMEGSNVAPEDDVLF